VVDLQNIDFDFGSGLAVLTLYDIGQKWSCALYVRLNTIVFCCLPDYS
jgi:hypothetical protein